MAKKEDKDICPVCGCGSWLGTSEGAKCKNCGYIKGQAPVQPEENK
jgi:tRNA(Ile2) C34 agmatinyltransferase TiaS